MLEISPALICFLIVVTKSAFFSIFFLFFFFINSSFYSGIFYKKQEYVKDNAGSLCWVVTTMFLKDILSDCNFTDFTVLRDKKMFGIFNTYPFALKVILFVYYCHDTFYIVLMRVSQRNMFLTQNADLVTSIGRVISKNADQFIYSNSTWWFSQFVNPKNLFSFTKLLILKFKLWKTRFGKCVITIFVHLNNHSH